MQPVRSAFKPIQQNDRTLQFVKVRIRFLNFVPAVINGIERFGARDAVRREPAGLLKLQYGFPCIGRKNTRNICLAQKAAVVQRILQLLHFFPFHTLLQHTDGRRVGGSDFKVGPMHISGLVICCSIEPFPIDKRLHFDALSGRKLCNDV